MSRSLNVGLLLILQVSTEKLKTRFQLSVFFEPSALTEIVDIEVIWDEKKNF
jgi:hypothetical protein